MRDDTIAAFLDQLAARVSAPGGGATAALHAAQAAALLAMVARYSDGPRYDAGLMNRIVTEADALREDALALAEADAKAFDAVAEAYRLPRTTERETSARSAAISSALAGAARPPADVVRTALLLVSLAEDLLPAGNRNVITDVAAAAEAARAAAVTARLIIEVNLKGITGPGAGRGVRGRSGGGRPGGRTGRRDRRRGTGGGRPVSLVMSGRELAASIRAETAALAAELTAAGRTPTLAVVTATADEASAWYVRSLSRTAAKVGIACDVTDLGPASPSRPESPDAAVESIRVELIALSENPLIHGIVLQTPLPGGARLAELAGLIDPAKDVDGANPTSLGRLMTGLPTFAPATAAAVLALLDRYEVALSGRRAVVVGRSAVVGKPVAQLLLARDATVTVCHSRTVDLAAVTSTAEVLVVAAGRAGLVGASFVAAGAVVVDVGTNASAGGGLAGDVDPAVAEVAGALSPVPGGVGPVTTALLLRHVVAAASPSGPA